MDFINQNIWIIATLVLSGGALVWRTVQRSGAKVSPLQATQLINQGKTLVLDVRSAADFGTGHIRDAKNIPLKELPKRIAELEKFKDRPVVVVCASGLHSVKATSQLKKAGFENATSLFGGLVAWQNAGLPMAK